MPVPGGTTDRHINPCKCSVEVRAISAVTGIDREPSVITTSARGSCSLLTSEQSGLSTNVSGGNSGETAVEVADSAVAEGVAGVRVAVGVTVGVDC
jgi:hypothetical protein